LQDERAKGHDFTVIATSNYFGVRKKFPLYRSDLSSYSRYLN